MNTRVFFVAIALLCAASFGGIIPAIAFAQSYPTYSSSSSGTYTSVLGTNGIVYTYNANTGTYMSSPTGVAYNPITQMYTYNGVTYSYNQNTRLYTAHGVFFTFNASTNTFTPITNSGVTTTTNASNSTIVFYTKTGTPIYATQGASIPAGLYYTARGRPLYYYGNGYYYNSTTQTYGSINNPSFISTTYPLTTTVATPGAPNTGEGGNAPLNWTLLILAAIITLSGSTYFVHRAVVAQRTISK